MRALISCGVYRLPSISLVFQSVPMCRLTERMVRSTLVTAWFLADWPTRTSPFLAKATTEGVVREPSEFAITVGSPPSRTVTTELVVPRSIPTARAMEMASLPCTGWCRAGPVAGGSSLAPGPLNFPAHPNGSPPDRVPGEGNRSRDPPRTPRHRPRLRATNRTFRHHRPRLSAANPALQRGVGGRNATVGPQEGTPATD